MGKSNYSEDFKRDAVHQIGVRGYSRRVIGWATQSCKPTDLVLQALLMAVWRRKPKQPELIHTDQGVQYTSRDWAAFLRAHSIEHPMSRRGNCHENARVHRLFGPMADLDLPESFFNLLKRERIRRRLNKTREQARQDIFDDIEMFYNPKRKHVRNGMLSPIDFENRQQNANQEGVSETRGYSHGLPANISNIKRQKALRKNSDVVFHYTRSISMTAFSKLHRSGRGDGQAS